MPFISSFEIIVVTPDLNMFLWIAAFVAAAAVNPNGVKMLLANSLSKFPFKGNPVFSNGLKSLPKNPLTCTILCNWGFDNFILVDEPFAKSVQSFETCELVNNSLWGKYFHH